MKACERTIADITPRTKKARPKRPPESNKVKTPLRDWNSEFSRPYEVWELALLLNCTGWTIGRFLKGERPSNMYKKALKSLTKDEVRIKDW